MRPRRFLTSAPREACAVARRARCHRLARRGGSGTHSPPLAQRGRRPCPRPEALDPPHSASKAAKSRPHPTHFWVEAPRGGLDREGNEAAALGPCLPGMAPQGETRPADKQAGRWIALRHAAPDGRERALRAWLRSRFLDAEPDRDPWASGVLRMFSEDRGSEEAQESGPRGCAASPAAGSETTAMLEKAC